MKKRMIQIGATANCTLAIFPTFCLPIVEYHAKFNLPNTNTSIVFYYVVQLLLLPFFAIATDQIVRYRAKCNMAIKTALSISSQTLTSQKAFSIFFMQIRGTELHVKYNKLKQIQIKQKKIKNTKLLKSSPDLKRPGLRPGRAAEGGRRGHRGNRPWRCGGSCDWNKLFIVFVYVVSINYTTIFHVKIRFVHCITILIFDPTFHVTENKQDLILSILRSSISNVETATSHLNQLRQDKHLSF